MDGQPNPPPPPPHGSNSKSSGLPPGNYDIFVIPPHSSGSGFLYLPSLQPHRNSFLAGVALSLLIVGIYSVVVPIIKHWTANVVASGGMGVVVFIMSVGVLGWALGKTQMEGSESAPGGGNNNSGGARQQQSAGTGYASSSRPFFGAGAGTGSSWQRSSPKAGATGWEKAREETRKREEERRKKEDAGKKTREAAEKDRFDKVRAREKEAREREAREKIGQERLRREERLRNEQDSRGNTKDDSPRNYHKPTAHSAAGDEDCYSYRPYDDPKPKQKHTANTSQSSIFSQSSSGIKSQSTARTTPPPSNRGAYRTKDPDKIVIKAVYLFVDGVPKATAQLIAGAGNVTDGLVLKMTTEGLFVDDDVRGVGQREWDVKAWTMKLVEVWCPQFAAKAAPSTVRYASSPQKKDPVQKFLSNNSVIKADLSNEELDLVVEDLLRTCKSSCHQSSNKSQLQNGELKGRHVLRATVRDSEGKRYVFIFPEEEAWKVAVGLQRLRRGTQVRAMGVAGLPANETKNILASLGWL